MNNRSHAFADESKLVWSDAKLLNVLRVKTKLPPYKPCIVATYDDTAVSIVGSNQRLKSLAHVIRLDNLEKDLD